METMNHETVEYDVLGHFIPAIIYDDETGLSDDESSELAGFMNEAETWAKNRPGYLSHHWTVDSETSNAGFGKCEISACFGDRVTLHLVIMVETGRFNRE